MKIVLCISPNFPPINSADMHRVRQSLPYFEEFNWKSVCFVVAPKFIESQRENLLLETLPSSVEIHKVNAFSVKWTRKFGLGNLGLRSWLQYRHAIDQYLELNKVDLIYFSTTVFTLMSLGPHWKKKYGIPFVIDLQDPWRNDYYLGLKSSKRPKKFWFDYRQKKYLEAFTMPKVNGIISVSEAYIDTMKSRYSGLDSLKCLTLPFSALETDRDVAQKSDAVSLDEKTINVVYIGRAGGDMAFSVKLLLTAFKRGLSRSFLTFNKLKFYFFGTSYAPNGQGEKTIEPIAKQLDVDRYVFESTDRLPYFQSLKTLDSADILFIPGSDDEKYTASKIFPYILARKPLLAIFHEKSSVVDIMHSTKIDSVIEFSIDSSYEKLTEKVLNLLAKMVNALPYEPHVDVAAFERYSAKEMTKRQCRYFDSVCSRYYE